MAVLAFILLAVLAAPPRSTEQIVAGMVRRSQTQDFELQDYSVTRKYTLHNRHLNGEASMTVRLEYRAGHGKHFSVLRSSGPGVAQRALASLIRDEERASEEKPDGNAMTSANYRFTLEGQDTQDGRLCYRMKISPRRDSRELIDGEVWVDAEEFAVVAIKGHPARSLSFWIGRPLIEQHFAPVNGFWMPSCNQTNAQVRFAGDTELNIEYWDYKFNLPALSLRAP